MENYTLRRSSTDRMVAGVAGGVAAMLHIDPVLVRLAFVILGLLNGIGVLLYAVMWLLVPTDQSLTTVPTDQVRENMSEIRNAAEQFVQRLRSMLSTI